MLTVEEFAEKYGYSFIPGPGTNVKADTGKNFNRIVMDMLPENTSDSVKETVKDMIRNEEPFAQGRIEDTRNTGEAI